MDDKKIFSLLLDSIKQDDKKTYFHFVSIKRTSRISDPSILTSIDSYKANYASLKKMINEHGIEVSQLKQTLRQVKETIQLLNCSSVFDLTYPLMITATLGFLHSLNSFIVFFLSKETDPFNTFAYSSLGTVSVLIAAFCVYRNNRKVIREARLQRLKNYLEDFIEDSKIEISLNLERDELVTLEAPAQVELELTT